jgi:protein tyrosine phosphatase (PTP) superfamily phosphohydrolase (DUF442 family)
MCTRLHWPILPAIIGLAGLLGCHHFCQQSCYPVAVPPSAYPPGNGCCPLPPCPPPRPGCPLPCPGPASAHPFPPAGTLPPSPPVSVGPPVTSQRPATPLTDIPWHPAPQPGAGLAVPQPAPPNPPQEPRLLPPQAIAPQGGVIQERTPAQPEAPRAGVNEERLRPLPVPPGTPPDNNNAPTPSLPVGIPQFATVKPRVATGLRPIALDGLDWLAANGYRTVVHLRQPNEDDAADRKQFEQRGLRYISLVVSPEALSREAVEQFNAAVTEAGNLPVFVYDRDGMLAGGLWYLHFRIIDGTGNDEAFAKAARFGLKPDPNGEHRLMVLAVIKYLEGQSK